MSLRIFTLALVLAASFVAATLCLQGQITDAPTGESVLFPETLSTEESVAEIRRKWELDGLDSAIASGFLSVAEILVDQLLESSESTQETVDLLNKRLEISLVMGKLDAARAVYERLQSDGFAVDPLIESMYLFFASDDEAFRISLNQIDPDELGPSERSWFILLQALLLARNDSLEQANQRFLEAEEAAPTELLSDHFEIIRLREDLKNGIYDEETVSALREAVRSMKGERGGFEAARLLAVALNRSGQSNLAVEVLSDHLALPGLREFGFRSDFLLLLGTIAGADSTRGRIALRQLVSEASADPEDLALAFSLLTQSYSGERDRETFLDDLETWLESSPSHPLTDRFLAFQAYLLIEKGELLEAETSALELYNGYPNSELMPTALRLLAYVSWNQRPPRYRTAADYLNQLRSKLPPGEQSLRTGVLIADCFFLNEDYSSASEAYAAALLEAPESLAPTVFFQQVLCEIGAGRAEAAGNLINAAFSDPRLELAVIWKAEWNLLDYLRRNARIQEAFERIESVLDLGDADGEQVPPGLFLRLKWIAARLTLEASEPASAEEQASSLLADLDSPRNESLPPELLQEVEANLLLLIGEARYARAEKAGALEVFTELRGKFPQSGPTILSYLVESRVESNQDNLVSAQQSLINLVDRFRDSEYAPIALWEAALNAEQRGLAIHLQEAITILERLVTDYPNHGLVYYARLKQGDLARRLNDFPTALLLYERLLAQYPQHPERYRAELSRADCLMALGSEDSSRYDVAAVIYERTCLLSEAPAAIRLEAGYKWAHALHEQGDIEAGEGILWLVYERFVLDPNLSQPVLTEDAGRYWMARVLLEIGDIQAKNGQSAVARRIFETIPLLGLPGKALAQAKLDSLR
ncbi:tetratricopeptide repeat protein [Puniceicoccales bacterium CK1056]|uniref:Tetratricopeptide repeat protein n=1 Tax=Oceanipulchritudo coccoides TaxID=2706888 RepID=A0A6B2M2L8_9BACT|nr:tetratricopeptide repeat protein [Oceanipulchritudo coccoides]NDV62626.1 tetratricopeptide repeat protein [Oceanipulchritudo coccoides]